MRVLALAVVCAVSIGLAGSGSQAAIAYDAAADFSATSNPAAGGVWRYGSSTSLSTYSFVISTTSDSSTSQLDAWLSNGASVVHNNTGANWTSSINVVFPAGALVLHPGSSGQLSVVRWTSPAAGEYAVQAAFANAGKLPDTYAATTDPHVLINGAPAWQAVINDANLVQNYSTQQFFNQGDTLDFAVGYGDGGYYYDSTSLQATITPVPEPSSLLGPSLALAGLLARRRRLI